MSVKVQIYEDFIDKFVKSYHLLKINEKMSAFPQREPLFLSTHKSTQKLN